MNKIVPLFIFLIILINLSHPVSAQTSFRISGKVADDNNTPVAYASITLCKAIDSTLIQGAITDEFGNYTFSTVTSGKIRVAASLIGKIKTYSQAVTLDAAHTIQIIPTLILKDNAHLLKGVNVTSSKPFIEHKMDKTVINVENSVVSAGNTALEVLEKAPGIMVDNDGNISLKGKNGVTIMIDGKPTYLSQQQVTEMLKAMNANTLSQIEIITNPSAKYDASGTAGIINIKLKKNTNEGLNGNATIGYNLGLHGQYNGGLNLNYKKGKVNLFGSLNGNQGSRWGELGLSRRFYNDDGKTLTTAMEQTSQRISEFTYRSFKAGMDYALDHKNTLGIMVDGSFSDRDETSNGPISFYDGAHQLDSLVSPHSVIQGNWHSITYNLNYKLEIDTTGQELIANFDYSTFDSKSDQNYSTAYFDGLGHEVRDPKYHRGNLPSVIDIKSGKVDYTLPLKNKTKFEAGLKTSIVTSNNNVAYENKVHGQWQNDPEATNHFIYKESINAAYVNLNKDFKKGWAVQLGLRGEQTVSDANQITIDSAVNRNYFQIFPSVFVKKDVNKNNTLTFSYSRRIDRPDYHCKLPRKEYVLKVDKKS